MGRLRLPQGRGSGVLLMLVAGAFLLAAAAGVLARQQPGAPAAVAPEAAAVLPHLAHEPRRFYITASNYRPDQALDACAAGYHMASLWELLDPTALDYASGFAGIKTRADQGSGPVAGWWGWARTGGDSYTANVAGRANCSLWTSTTAGQYGTTVQLLDSWTAPAVAISPWYSQTWLCTGIAPVWCVSDLVYGVWLPVMKK